MAKELISGFPKNYVLWTDPETNSQISVSASAGSKRNVKRSNRWAASWPTGYDFFKSKSLADGTDGIAGYEFAAPRHRSPYVAECRDFNDHPLYSIRFWITDYDVDFSTDPSGQAPNSPKLNNYGDWTSTLDIIDPQ